MPPIRWGLQGPAEVRDFTSSKLWSFKEERGSLNTWGIKTTGLHKDMPPAQLGCCFWCLKGTSLFNEQTWHFNQGWHGRKVFIKTNYLLSNFCCFLVQLWVGPHLNIDIIWVFSLGQSTSIKYLTCWSLLMQLLALGVAAGLKWNVFQTSNFCLFFKKRILARTQMNQF